jgi:hypothetical protein
VREPDLQHAGRSRRLVGGVGEPVPWTEAHAAS